MIYLIPKSFDYKSVVEQLQKEQLVVKGTKMIILVIKEAFIWAVALYAVKYWFFVTSLKHIREEASVLITIHGFASLLLIRKK